MRPIEIILVATLFVSLVCSSLSLASSGTPAEQLAKLSLLTALAAFLLHLWLEGVHWQMAPAYVAMLLAGLLVRFALIHRTQMSWPWETAGFLLIASACAFSWAIPMFRLPAPTGGYAVGTSILYVADPSRMEDASPVPGGKRELMVQLWYPAERGQGKLASYRRRVETTLESSYQALLPTHSRIDAPVDRSGAPYPLLLFNPAWRGRRTQDTFLTEELASHGYVVAAIDHTYNSMPVAFPDGRVVISTPVAAIERLMHTTPAEVERIGNAEADKQALDVSSVLNELTMLNQQHGSPWYRTMDMAHAGALGHSLGGGVSVQAWATDSRIHAALNMDGWTFGSQAAQAVRATPADNISHPMLFIYEDGLVPPPLSAEQVAAMHTWSPKAIEAVMDAWDHDHVRPLIENYGGYFLKLKGSIHPTFTDKPLTSPISSLSGVGPINPQRAHRIIRDCAVQFFDQALKGRPSPLLSGKGTSYPELVTVLNVDGTKSASP